MPYIQIAEVKSPGSKYKVSVNRMHVSGDASFVQLIELMFSVLHKDVFSCELVSK